MFPPGPERVSVRGSAAVPAVTGVPAAAVMFALVAALPVVGAGPLALPSLPAVVAAAPLVLVFLGGREVRGPALPVPLSLPLALPLDGGARPGARAGALPLVSGAAAAAAVAVATGDLGVAVAMVAGLWLEVGEEWRGLVSPWRRAAGARARAVGPGATASAVVTVEERDRS